MNIRALPILVISLLLALTAGPALGRPAPPATVTAQAPRNSASGLIVRLRPAADPALQAASPDAASALAADLSTQLGADLTYLKPMSGGALVYRFDQTLPADQALALAERLRADPRVLSAEPDLRMYPARVPNDALYSTLWNLAPAAAELYGIDAPAAWEITTGDPNLVIAVIDTGILKDHTDLAGRFVGGYDFVTNPFTANDGGGRDEDASDPGDWISERDLGSHGECGYVPEASTWHGSHVAGIIAAAADNGAGISGINWQSKILPVRVLGKCGGEYSDVIDAIRWAGGLPVPGAPPNPNPARVINLSLGGRSVTGCSDEMQFAINDVMARGAVVVVAAGNNFEDASFNTPANCAGVITVGASDRNGINPNYSNTGAAIEIGAPGGSLGFPIYSTVNNGGTTPNPVGSIYGPAVGTSMAAPHVSAVVSLILSVYPGVSQDMIVRILQETSTPYDPSAWCNYDQSCGQSGIVNAGRAVQRAAELGYVFSPNDFSTAYGGLPDQPALLVVRTIASGAPEGTRVWVGGLEAAVVSAQTVDNRDEITVQLPAQPAPGFYPLRVSLGSPGSKSTREVTYQHAVFYGWRMLLPVGSH